MSPPGGGNVEQERGGARRPAEAEVPVRPHGNHGAKFWLNVSPDVLNLLPFQ